MIGQIGIQSDITIEILFLIFLILSLNDNLSQQTIACHGSSFFKAIQIYELQSPYIIFYR